MDNTLKDIPSIKTFIVNNKFYCYDAYTNNIFNVTRDHFDELNLLQKLGVKEYKKLAKRNFVAKDILLLIEKGYFKTNFIDKVSHPESEYVYDIIKRGIYDMTLQVTRDCNFKCRYCSFTRDHHLDRTHEDSYMTWDVAKKSIDFLFENSKDSEEIYLSFYGGEPLLNFDLIVKSVEYAKSIFETKKVFYNMTTNGSIMSDYIADFLVKHEFRLLISLDGPSEYQNNHRKFYSNGGNTFDVVMKNLKILSRHTDYYHRYVQFSPVLLKDEDAEIMFNFFESIGFNKNDIDYTLANMNGIDYIERDILKSEKKNSLKSKKRYELDNNDTVTKNFIARMESKISDKGTISGTWHHSGPCIPSVTKLFVNVWGDLFPCEKIIESPCSKIGDINHGLNLDKIQQQMNVGKITEDECKSCWAIRFCEICVMRCIDFETNTLSASLKQQSCVFQKRNIEDYLKYYVSINPSKD